MKQAEADFTFIYDVGRRLYLTSTPPAPDGGSSESSPPPPPPTPPNEMEKTKAFLLGLKLANILKKIKYPKLNGKDFADRQRQIGNPNGIKTDIAETYKRLGFDPNLPPFATVLYDPNRAPDSQGFMENAGPTEDSAEDEVGDIEIALRKLHSVDPDHCELFWIPCSF
jgi:hypothetical protein